MTVPDHVGVIGGGRMGAGIAHAFLLAGSRVTVIEQNDSAAEIAHARVSELIQKSADRGWSGSVADATAKLATGTNAQDLNSATLVVEAVPESRALKAVALTKVSEVVSRDAVIASNTSSISISDLAAAVENPHRFIGMHFFNPVPASSLVEIVVGTHTDQQVVANAKTWIEDLGKTAITVTDAPGFASSRLGVALALEAIRMVEQGVASAADIDTAMELGYRHPMGPLRTTDIVGLDVRLGIAEELQREYGDRFAPPELMKKLVAEGHLGRKSGRGFYEWSTE